ncbi:MAG: TIGR02584 family CRISPR-associated protein [Limnobacter sp.]|nr:TIGR02584 family CRISPR-associated protein [Limnobacter sp.]
MASLPTKALQFFCTTMTYMKTHTIKPLTNERRRILICVTGLSPQIVTETLYALCVASEQPWIPHEVWLITTRRGADNARLMLLSEQPGWFKKLLQEWQIPQIDFDEKHIHILMGSDGQPMDDIRDDTDNAKVADGISDFIRRFAANEHSEIHASIAGGRKTMGFFLGYAMSLWGRAQDRLSHVLVSPSFESQPEFFYPAPKPTVIASSRLGQDPLDTSTAKVWLGDIPFVRFRSLLPSALTQQNVGFAAAVQFVNQTLDQIKLTVDPANKQVFINGQAIRLQPMQLSILAVMAWFCQKGLPDLKAPSKEVDDAQWRRETLNALKQAIGEMNIAPSVDQWLNTAYPAGDTFSQQLSKLERTLRESGFLPLRSFIRRNHHEHGNRQRSYQLDLQPENICFLVNQSKNETK